jgi:type VI secretion system secreted protein Hcp
MLIEIRYRDHKGNVHHGGKSPIHGLKLGSETLTPRNVGFKIQSLSPRDASSGLASGKRQHSPLVITKETDSASPNLFQHCISGNQLISQITLNFWNPNRQGKPESVAYTIELTNATIAGYERIHALHGNSEQSSHASALSTNELERFKLIFQKITFTNVMKSKSTTDDWMGG